MKNYKETANIFKAFCDENRLMILNQLTTGEKCACDLLEELNIARSTLSHHMKILVAGGIVKERKEGAWIHYSIDKDGIVASSNFLKEFTDLL